MARKNAKSRKSASRLSHELPVEHDTPMETMNIAPELRVGVPWYKNKTVWGLVLAGLILVGVLAVRKGMVVVAIVNGQPIFRWNLDSALVSRFGKQTLEGMIGESLIEGAAQDANITVTKEEIAAKEDEIMKSFGGQANIDDLLKLQGVSRADFDKQIKTQLMVQKILSKDLTITDNDIDNFIATSAATLIATEPAALREEARRTIIDQKVGERVQSWFADLRDKAKITHFLPQ